jgi:putative nucleotidyltransferase with HDIG domain/prepilin-type processing-associated H-X9-DG protein
MADLASNFAPRTLPGHILPQAQALSTAQHLRPLGVWLAMIAKSSRGGVNVLWHDGHTSMAEVSSHGNNILHQLTWDEVSSREQFSVLESGGFKLLFGPAIDRHNGVHPVLMIRQDSSLDPSFLGALAAMTHDRLADARKQASLSGEVESLSLQLSDTYEEVSLIYQLSGGMTINKDPAKLLQEVADDMMAVMHIRGMGVLLQAGAPGNDSFRIHGEATLPGHIMARLALDLNRVLRERQAAILSNQLRRSEFDYLVPHVEQMLAVPILRQELLLGALVAFDKDSNEFDTSDAKLLSSIANQTGVFLENTGLFSDLNSLVMGLLHSLTSAVDAKDAYTCGHSQRVALLARQVARQAQLPTSFCERVYMAGVLHDVGKIGVPESVLQKPGRLTNEEFELMKGHVEIGAKILRDVKQVEDLIPGVRHHHERFDGRGYPDRLAGSDIPLIARLLCLADCFDAMTSNRTYRKALPIEIARMEIQRCSGTQFDPSLADAFLEIPIDLIRDTINTIGEAPKPEPAVVEPTHAQKILLAA